MQEKYDILSTSKITQLQSFLAYPTLSDVESKRKYSKDENKVISSQPEIIVFPIDKFEVQKIVEFAKANRIPITPRGSGTSVTGSAVPLYGGIVLSLEKMDKIIEIDQTNMCVTVQPGIINSVLQQALSAKNLFYPPDPASMDSCSIGGNIALCAGGMKAVKYGVTRDYVLGLEVITAEGQILTLGGKLRKDVNGYNLLSLFIGSEGTLGIITSATLKILPLPKYRTDLWIPFSKTNEALTIVPKLRELQHLPTIIEFLDKRCITAWEYVENKKHQFSQAACHLILQFDSNNSKELENTCEQAGQLCLDNNAMDVLIAQTPEESKKVWDIRNKISECLTIWSGAKISHDIVVPLSRIKDFLDEISILEKNAGVTIVGYGHLGDGNIHVNILKRQTQQNRWELIINDLQNKLMEIVINMNGSISGEHGIGYTKRNYSQYTLKNAGYEYMLKIKDIFDPTGIFNPGKIFTPVTEE